MREHVKILGKAFNISVSIRDKLSLLVVILGFPMAFIPAAMAVKLKDLTNDIQKLVYDADLLKVSLYDAGILIGLFTLQLVFGFLKTYTQTVDSKITMVRYIKKRILEHRCEVKYKYIENYDNFNEKINFAETQAGTQVAASFQALTDVLQNLIKFVSVLYLLLQVNIWIVVIILITSIPAMIISQKQKDELYYARARWIKENSLALHYYYICSNDGNLAEIRHLGMQDYLQSRWREFCDTYIEKKRELTVRHVKYNMLADGLRNIVYIAILSFTAYLIYSDRSIGLGIFALVYTLTGQLQEITAILFNQIMQLISNIEYMRDFFYLDTLQKDENESTAEFVGSGDIVFEGVNFQYPNSEKKIFENLNVTIKEGQKIAILGENGSGKSTFISLLCGMFEPDEGRITIKNQDIKENIAEVRKNISVVLQDFGRYNDSLRNNITISDERKTSSDEEIIDIAQKLNVMDVVNSQENGLDELIGAFSAESNDLSGGQWQKVAILRAAYKDTANIMILDEPTSALDPLAEAQIYKDFSKLTGDRTTILVSHRLGITSLVDRILVFKEGKIVEDGTHEELIGKDGEYSRMYKAQAEWYV